MRTFSLFLLLAVFLSSAFLNCALYGSIARVPYFGVTITEYAEKERDVFLLMYIAGGAQLPHNDKFSELSFSLARRAYKKAFTDTVKHPERIGPYATRTTFDLPAALVRILYWVPPLALALIFIVMLIPRARPSEDEE